MRETDRIIDNIYEASIVPELWEAALDSLGGLVRGSGGVMVIRHADGWGHWKACGGLQQPMIRFMQSDIPQRTQATARLLEADHPGFLSEQDIFSPEMRAADPLFSELLRPHGFGSSIASAIGLPSADVAVFIFARQLSQGEFDSKTIERIDHLRPHLARSAMLASRLRLQRLQAAAEALAIIGLPAAILSPQGRVLAANVLLQQMNKHVCWRPQDRMALRNVAANTLLEQAIAIPRSGGAAGARSFPVPTSDGGDAMVGHLIPTPGQARDIFDGAGAVFVLTPVSAPQAPDAFIIQTLFDLTPAEARVARGLAEGATVATLAKRLGVSEGTIRSQVKSMLSKTGVQRQKDLVGLLATIPRLPV